MLLSFPCVNQCVFMSLLLFFLAIYRILPSYKSWNQGRKHFLELLTANAASWKKKKCIPPNVTLHMLTAIFKEQPCIYLGDILPLCHAYCKIVCMPDGQQHYFQYPQAWVPPWWSTFFTGAWLDLCLLLELADSCLVCLLSWVGGLLSTGSELVEGTGSELSSCLWKKKSVFCIVFLDTLSCKIWSVPHTNEWQETGNVAGNCHRAWTTTDLVQCHWPWPGSCQSWYALATNFIPWC